MQSVHTYLIYIYYSCFRNVIIHLILLKMCVTLKLKVYCHNKFEKIDTFIAISIKLVYIVLDEFFTLR